MKYLICSDIHGSESECRKVIDAFYRLNCDRILLLGDTLYHGPRNDLPVGHNPKGVVELLNSLSDKIIGCRGNCDAEVDQKVLKFPIMADYVEIIDGPYTLFCTHGHVYAPRNEGAFIPNCEDTKVPLLRDNSILFYGHTHIPVLKQEGKVLICNPGSVSLPKGGSDKGFALYEDGKVTLYNLDQHILKTLSF